MKKGFTLIELIVVIAIIAILSIILVPQIAGYIENSQQSVALSSCRTVADSAQLYIVEQTILSEKEELNEDILSDLNSLEDGVITSLSIIDNELVKFTYNQDSDTKAYYSNNTCGFASSSYTYYQEVDEIYADQSNQNMLGQNFQSKYESITYENDGETYTILSDLKETSSTSNTKTLFQFASLSNTEKFVNSTVDYIYNPDSDSWYKLETADSQDSSVDLRDLYNNASYTRFMEDVIDNALFESEEDIPADNSLDFYWVFDPSFNP